MSLALDECGNFLMIEAATCTNKLYIGCKLYAHRNTDIKSPQHK